MNNIIHQGELEKNQGGWLNVHFGPKMAGNERFFGQNRRNLPFSNRKQNHNPKLFFSDKIKQYHMIIGGGGGLKKIRGFPLDTPPPSLPLRSQ